MVLDLSKADTSGFEPMDAGTYDATVYEVTEGETKGGPDAKLPAGTPKWNIQFRIGNEVNEKYENRRVFRQLTIAPDKKADGTKNEKKAASDGMIVKFLTDIGYDEALIKSGKFNPDFSDMAGRRCRVTINKKQKYQTKPEDNEWQNDVVGTKPYIGTIGGGIE